MKDQATDQITEDNIKYKWVIIAACFAMVFTCLGFCSSTNTLYLAAITNALNIKRSLLSINYSCRYITATVVNMFFGSLITRFGSKKLIGAGFVSLILAMLINAKAENVYMFYLGGIFTGLGLAWTTTTMVGYLVNRFFKERSGTVMGFILAANGVGGAVALQIVSPIIYNDANPFGYRSAYLLTAVILLVTGLILQFLLRVLPNKNNNTASLDLAAKSYKEDESIGNKPRFAVPKSHLYLTAICVFLTSMILQGSGGVSAAHMNDVGMNVAFTATVLTVHSLTLAAFKFLTGIMHDKFGLRVSMIICYVAGVVSIFMLAVITPSETGMVFAMGYGVLSSLALPLNTIMLPFISLHLSGERYYVKMLGILVSICNAGYIIGMPVTNLFYEVNGTYKPVLFVFNGVMLAIGIVSQLILKRTAAEKSARKTVRQKAASS